jgi:predicted DNA-binding transcriptional regulator AlpA
MHKVPLERLLHTREAAKLLGVSAAWLERKRWEGRPPQYVRVGGPNGRAIRYRESDLQAYIEENIVTPAPRMKPALARMPSSWP